MSSFRKNQETTSVSLTQQSPINGQQSLLIGITGYGDSILWDGAALGSSSPYRRGTAYRVSARIRATASLSLIHI